MKLRGKAAAIVVLVLLVVTTSGCGDAGDSRSAGQRGADKVRDSAAGSRQGRAANTKPVQNRYASQIPPFTEAPQPVKVALPNNDGKAPVISRVPTDHPVAFITIDDGNVRNGEAPELLRAPHTPVSAFLISRIAAQDPGFFGQLNSDGMPIEAHSITHTNLRNHSYADQKQEICGSADELAATFGQRPTLFRPPFGEYDDNTLRAAHDCGMSAVVYWSESVKDGNVYYQTPEKTVKSGDILLLHFRDALVTDLLAALQAIYDSGLTPALLEDYLP